MSAISIRRLSVALALLWLGTAGAAQDKKAPPPAKTAEAERKAGPSSEKSAELPEVKLDRPAGTAQRAASRRDPFRPFTTTTTTTARRRENLSPLERYEIGQLKLVGVIWDIKNPTALVEDSSGLGYTVRVGTPIGVNDGRVKRIAPDGVVIEEEYSDFQGARRKREVSLRLTVE